MPEYIDREKLIQAGRKIALKDITPNWNMPLVESALIEQGQTLLKLIKEQPTADVVKVVRCKDCKNYTKWEQASAKWEGKALHCIKFRRKVNPNDFCSYGELKEREG